MTGGVFQMLWVAAYGGLLLTSMLTDIRWLRIPNLIPLLLIVLFLVVAAATALSGRPVNWGSHLLAGGIVLVVGIGLFAWSKIGGGDVKLLTAVALWHGLRLLPALLIGVALAGGVLAIICVAMRRSGLGVFLASRGVQTVVLEDGAGIPYAVAIVAACGLLLNQLPLLSH